jgi:histidinol-phosphatase (PHP family)
MQLFNFHTHTNYCDGNSEPEAYVKKAIDLGFLKLGFSGHAPVPFKNGFAIKEEELNSYCNEILRLKDKYKEFITIYLALEIDFIPGLTKNFNELKKQCELDYTIGSIHLVSNIEQKKLWFIDGSKIEDYDDGLQKAFDNNIKKGVTAFYHQTNEMLLYQNPDIIGHFDKIKMNNRNRYFLQNEKWYQQLISETLIIIKEKETIIEVNTRGLYKKRSDELFPGIDVLKQILQLNIPITVSSDAHKPEELPLLLNETNSILKKIGFRSLRVFNGKFWVEESI